MRLNAEKDRVDKFKDVALSQTKHYYNVLEKFAKLLDKRKSSEEIEPLTTSDHTLAKHSSKPEDVDF